jgi:hypothetical protein
VISRVEALEQIVYDLLHRMTLTEGRTAAAEQGVWQQWATPGGGGGGSGGEAQYALIGGGGISARSGTTLGSGTVTPYLKAGGTLTAGSSTITLYSAYSTVTGNAGGFVWYFPRPDGTGDVLIYECGSFTGV